MAQTIDKDKLWQATLGELELSISKANFTTWFRNTFILGISEQKAVVGVPNAFTQAWLQSKYNKLIVSSLQHISQGAIREVEYRVAQQDQHQDLYEPVVQKQANDTSQKNKTQKPSPSKPIDARQEINKYGLNQRYTFENFVVGKANQLAHAAAQAVSNRPGEVYNPLFVYGGSGMGKTHLIQAIGHFIKKQDPSRSVLYVACEKFTNEFIAAITQGRTEQFKSKYRNTDVLLIDDIQFLANKEGTQEEFFHTFNSLHQTNKQIVLSSDRPPKAIRQLEERLVSRFEWGMLVDLPQPDLETRIAILNSKCAERNYPLAEDVVSYVARHFQNNIRELEGVLNRIMAYHNLNNTTPTLESVKGILQTTKQTPLSRALTNKDIISAVINYYGISTTSLLGSSRQKELVVPRQITMYLLREELRSSYPSIGQEIGGRDHTTAMHAYEKIKHAVDEDEKIRRDIEQLRQRLYE